MAIGDTFSSVVSLTNASSVFIKPNSGSEWILHSIWHSRPIFAGLATSGAAGFFGVSSIALTIGPAWDTGLVAHLTNSIFMVLNTQSAQVIGWDGIQSK